MRSVSHRLKTSIFSILRLLVSQSKSRISPSFTTITRLSSLGILLAMLPLLVFDACGLPRISQGELKPRKQLHLGGYTTASFCSRDVRRWRSLASPNPSIRFPYSRQGRDCIHIADCGVSPGQKSGAQPFTDLRTLTTDTCKYLFRSCAIHTKT